MRRTSIFLVPALVDAAICANQSQPEGVVKVGIMKLEIVWRNPHPWNKETPGKTNCCRCVWSALRGS